jgi:hypothetical protein
VERNFGHYYVTRLAWWWITKVVDAWWRSFRSFLCSLSNPSESFSYEHANGPVGKERHRCADGSSLRSNNLFKLCNYQMARRDLNFQSLEPRCQFPHWSVLAMLQKTWLEMGQSHSWANIFQLRLPGPMMSFYCQASRKTPFGSLNSVSEFEETKVHQTPCSNSKRSHI